MVALEAIQRRSFWRLDLALDKNYEVVPRRPTRREALTRQSTLTVQRVIHHDRLVVCLNDHDRVRLLRAPDGFHADVSNRESTTLDEAAQFIVSERVFSRAGEAEITRSFDRAQRFGPNRGLQSHSARRCSSVRSRPSPASTIRRRAGTHE